MADDVIDGRTFDEWKRLVDRAVVKRSGIGCDDLPDVDYWQMWNDGTSPDDAMIEVLETAGFPLEDL